MSKTHASQLTIVTYGLPPHKRKKPLYLNPKIFDKPLVSQEVTGHVSVTIVDQCPDTHRQQLQIKVFHRRVQSCVSVTHNVTVFERKKSVNVWPWPNRSPTRPGAEVYQVLH